MATGINDATNRFYYEDGKLISKKSNKRIGFIVPSGYRHVKISGINYPEHRVVFLLCHGYLPDLIDHKNGIKTDNRIENLREASRGQNRANSVVNKDNLTGYKGVNCRPIRKDRKYRARILGKHLGWFETIEEASEAYNTAALEIHKEFARVSNNKGELNIGD